MDMSRKAIEERKKLPWWGHLTKGFLDGKNTTENKDGDPDWKRFEDLDAWYKQYRIDSHIQNHFPDRYDWSCPHCARQGWLPGIRGDK
jgi:hypothetical protein